jgi:hypothetical protein
MTERMELSSLVFRSGGAAGEMFHAVVRYAWGEAACLVPIVQPLTNLVFGGSKTKKPLNVFSGFLLNLVPRRGLEPPRCYSLVPETSASTNSATWAFQGKHDSIPKT